MLTISFCSFTPRKIQEFYHLVSCCVQFINSIILFQVLYNLYNCSIFNLEYNIIPCLILRFLYQFHNMTVDEKIYRNVMQKSSNLERTNHWEPCVDDADNTQMMIKYLLSITLKHCNDLGRAHIHWRYPTLTNTSLGVYFEFSSHCNDAK